MVEAIISEEYVSKIIRTKETSKPAPVHKIFGNGIEGINNVPGVNPTNWRFNCETQNYDYIGPDDADNKKPGV